MNRRGFVIGDAIMTIVTIIVIVFIMGTFVLVASAIAGLKKPEIDKVVLLSQKEDLLNKRILVTLKNKEQQELFVYEAEILFENDLLEQQTFIEGLKKIVTKEKPCLLISKSPRPGAVGETGVDAYDDIFIKLLKEEDHLIGNPGNTPIMGIAYKGAGVLSKIQFKNNEGELVYVEYYHGTCIE